MGTAYIIKDARGYWCAMRRQADKSAVHMWTTKRADAAQFHFYEAALRVQSSIPQQAKIITVPADR